MDNTSQKNINGSTVFLIIWLTLQLILMLLTLGFAYLGECTAGRASNFWSMLWGKGLGGMLLISNLVSLISGIVGLATKKGRKLRGLISVLLIIAFPLGLFCLILAIGSQF
ncbi:MAG: hypothetical protein J6P78_02915 [Lachnospiraceae bacterium]|nr:hypothetical protein [Lachnospiraceae bacterium]